MATYESGSAGNEHVSAHRIVLNESTSPAHQMTPEEILEEHLIAATGTVQEASIIGESGIRLDPQPQLPRSPSF